MLPNPPMASRRLALGLAVLAALVIGVPAAVRLVATAPLPWRTHNAADRAP